MSTAITATAFNPATAATAPGSSRLPQKALGQADFLKLLTVQLAQQDPMKPMDDTSFVTQMAQFSTLQQGTQMATSMASLNTDVSLQSATAMIGHQVTLNTSAGPVSGPVDSVDNSTSTVQLNVGGNLYPLSQVVGIAP